MNKSADVRFPPATTIDYASQPPDDPTSSHTTPTTDQGASRKEKFWKKYENLCETNKTVSNSKRLRKVARRQQQYAQFQEALYDEWQYQKEHSQLTDRHTPPPILSPSYRQQPVLQSPHAASHTPPPQS
eukprot:747682_1